MTELSYRTSRSSGPGGQHVNKTESKVELLWKPVDSECLSEKEKERILRYLEPRLTDQGVLILSSEKYRSQHRNKEEVSERFFRIISLALIPPKKRKPTKPTRSSQERRIKQKKLRGEIKRSRKNPPGES